MKILLFRAKKRKNLPLRGKFDRPRAEKLQGAQFFRNYWQKPSRNVFGGPIRVPANSDTLNLDHGS